MADVFTKKKRSEVMSRIRSRGNLATELALATLLRKNHITGWRRHLPIVGRPDFVFKHIRLAVFVDGCFWHCCKTCGNIPANNHEFWKAKLEGNRKRDRTVNRTLRKKGWKVLRIWEHELANSARVLQRFALITS
ncbi:MAG: very short patch repair endonuclease [Negativicutes bacterium]|nr:very short patch repair endonuclease [Negativicutes bacterium]